MCVCVCVCAALERGKMVKGQKGHLNSQGVILSPYQPPGLPALLSCHVMGHGKRLAAGGDIARETDGHPTSPREARSVGCIYFVVSSRHFGLAMGTANYYILFSHACRIDSFRRNWSWKYW